MMKYKLFIGLTVILVILISWGCSEDSDDNPVDSTAGSNSPLDTIAPRLMIMQPVNGSNGVPINITIAARFTEKMDSTSFNDSTFYLSDGVGTEITYADNWVRLRPYQNLQNSHTYTITLSTFVKDTSGNSLAGQYLWSFTTIAIDIVPPGVIATTPANGATEVALNTNIIVEFSEPMDTTTINENSFSVTPGVSGVISFQGNSATFNPSENLDSGNTYVVILSTLIKDRAGNYLPSSYNWSFSTDLGDTIFTGDSTAPQIIAHEPEDGALNIPLDAVITVNFSEEIDPATLTAATFYMDGGITGAVSYDNLTATLIPDNPLDSNQTYTATATSGITDTAGNHLPEDYSWSFTTWPGGEMMPLAIGNLWEYHVKVYDTLHMTNDYYDTILIVSDTIIGLEQWFIDQKGGLYTNRPDGLWIMGNGTPYLFIKYPAKAGENYNSYSSYENYPKEAYVISTNYQLNIPIGSFDTYVCKQYYTMYGGFYYYYFPKMGMVYHFFDLAGTVYLTRTLTKVELQ